MITPVTRSVELRLRELEAEYRAGEAQLAELDNRRDELSATMLRISGAIQVLTELLTAERQAEAQLSEEGETLAVAAVSGQP